MLQTMRNHQQLQIKIHDNRNCTSTTSSEATKKLFSGEATRDCHNHPPKKWVECNKWVTHKIHCNSSESNTLAESIGVQDVAFLQSHMLLLYYVLCQLSFIPYSPRPAPVDSQMADQGHGPSLPSSLVYENFCNNRDTLQMLVAGVRLSPTLLLAVQQPA